MKRGKIILARKFTNEQELKIIEEYQNGKNTKILGKEYNVSGPTISNILKRHGLHGRNQSEAKRKYKINENYFDNIDTPNKAYVLGFIYADGCNHIPRNLIKITLKSTDRNILELIKKELEAQQKLTVIEPRGYNNEAINLSITNKHISEQLAKLGCVQNKSLTLKFPNFIPDELMSHFIRGYFDGDGYIQDPEKRNNCTMIDIVSSKFFIDELQKYLQDKLGIESKIRIMQNPATESLYILKTQHVKIFCDWIYKDADIYMERKYKRYIKKFYPELLSK